MRGITNILILIFFVACNVYNPKDKPFIYIDASILRAFDTTRVYFDTTKTYKAFDIKLTIENKSKEPVSFWMMTCSWEDNFIVNNDYVDFIPHECDGNFPRSIYLKSNERKELKSSILKYEMTRYQTINTTKFGLIYIDTLNSKNPLYFDEIMGDKSRHDKIIWSNAIYLKNNQ